jgi:hypothetical protein
MKINIRLAQLISGVLALLAATSTLADSWSGNGLSFNGGNGTMNIGAVPIQPPWTAEFWVNRQDSPAYSSVLLADVNTALKLEQYDFTRQVGFTQFGVADYKFNYIAPAGTWTHLAYVCDGSTTKLYVNGVLQGSINATIALPLGQLGNDKAADHLDGVIDEVRVWNVVRSQGNIQANMNQPLIPPLPGLVAYWRFDESEGNFAADSSGQRQIGTLTNGPVWTPTAIPSVTVVGFDNLPAGTLVGDQYQFLAGPGSPNETCTGVGVYFSAQDYPSPCIFPAIAQVPSGEAQSGAQVLNIFNQGDCMYTLTNGEFAGSYAKGRFTTTPNRVAVYAGLFDGQNGSETVTLTAYDIFNNPIGHSTGAVTPGAGFHNRLEVQSSSANIVSFTVTEGTGGYAVGIDDLNFTIPPIPPPPDFYLGVAPLGTSDHIAAGVASYYLKLFDYGLNCCEGPVQLTVSGLPPGVSCAIANNPLAQSPVTTTTLTFTASPTAPATGYPGALVTITGTPQSASAGIAPRSVQTRIVVIPPFTVTGPSSMTLIRCITNSFPITVYADAAFSGSVNLSLGNLPLGFEYSFSPNPVVAGPGGEVASTLNIFSHLPNGAYRGQPITIVGQNGSQTSVAQSSLTVLSGTIDSFSPASGYAPQSLQPGSVVTLHGSGYAPGCMVQFGNMYATNTPLAISPDGTQLTVRVPRLATTGPLAVLYPQNAQYDCIFPSTGTFTVYTYRNVNGFPFNNNDNGPCTFQYEVGGYSLQDFIDYYGGEQFIKGPDFCSIFCFPCTCTGVPVGLPDPWALLVLGICDHELGTGGQCYGISDASLRLLYNDGKRVGDFQPQSPIPDGGSPFGAWSLLGPDSGQCYEGSHNLQHYVHLHHLAQCSLEYIGNWIGDSGYHLTSGSSGVYQELENLLGHGDHPLVSLTHGTEGHAVVAYDLESMDGTMNNFYIYVYNPNAPFTVGENSNADTHMTEEFQHSRILVTADGTWSFDGDFSDGVWNNTLNELVFVPRGVIPNRPTIPSNGNFLRFVVFDGAATSQITDTNGHVMLAVDGSMNTNPATRFPAGGVFPPLSGTHKTDSYIVGTNMPCTQVLHGVSNGTYTAYHIGNNFQVQWMNMPATTNTQDTVHFDPAGSAVFSTADASKSVSALVMARASNLFPRVATIATTSFQNGSDGIGFSTARDSMTYTHSGSRTVFSLSVTYPNTNGQNEYFFLQNQAIGSGDAATISPTDWSNLNSAPIILTIVHTNGTTNQSAVPSDQGMINFNNNVIGSPVAPVYGVDPANPGLANTGNTPGGNPAGTQTYGGSLLAGTNFLAQLYGGPTNTPDELLAPVSAAVGFGSGASSGFILSPGVISVACAPPGQTARLQLRVWDSRSGLHTNYESAVGDPLAARGVSQSFNSQPLGGDTFNIPNLAGLTSFNIWLPGTNANAWIASGDGKWESAGNWQQGTPSTSQSGVLIGNPGSKSVILDTNTATYLPASMTVSNVTVADSSGALNTLLLDQIGTNVPLHVLTEIDLAGGGALTVNNSRLQLDSRLRIGDAGAATFELDSGIAQIGDVHVGVNQGQGTLRLDGGVFTIGGGALSVAESLSTGTVAIAGAALNLTGSGMVLGNSGIGQLSISSGSAQLPSLQIGNAAGSQGTVTISGGTVSVPQWVSIGNTAGALPCSVTVSGAGAVYVTNASKNAYIGVNSGSLVLSGGFIQADSLQATYSSGHVQFPSGTMTLGGSIVSNGLALVVGDGLSSAFLNLPSGVHIFNNGLVTSPNSSLFLGCAVINGGIINNGTVIAACSNGIVTINGPFTNNGAITVSNQATLVFNGPVVNNSSMTATPGASLQFDGGLIDNGSVNGTVAGPAVIVTEPQSQVVNQWAGAGFNVYAAGSVPLSYQWLHAGTNLPGAISSAYNINSALPINAGNYQVIVSNAFGTITSSIASLTINPPPPATTPGTKVLVNGVVVLLDDFERVASGSQPVPEFGSWSNVSSEVLVTNADVPGPEQENQYLEIENNALAGTLGVLLSVPATNSGDVVQFDTMAYVSPLAYGITAPFQFLAYTTPGMSNVLGAARLYAWIGPDGTVYSYTGSGNGVPTLTRVAYGRWQHWEIKYVVGSYLWSWFVDGDGDSNIGVNQSVPNPIIESLQLVATTNGIPLYLDGMPDLALLNPRVNQGIFSFDLNTVAGKFYVVQYKNDLNSPNWLTSPTILAGDGTLQTYSEPVSPSRRIYRVVLQQ